MLHFAALLGRAGPLRFLLSRGASVHTTDGHGATPLFVAAAMGHADCVAALLDAGADANAAHPEGGALPLHVAVAAHISRKKPLDVVDAAAENRVRCVELLVPATQDALALDEAA